MKIKKTIFLNKPKRAWGVTNHFVIRLGTGGTAVPPGGSPPLIKMIQSGHHFQNISLNHNF